MTIVKVIHICNRCGKEIPTYKKKDCLGIEHEYLKQGRINLLPSLEQHDIHLCENCAKLTDLELELFKRDCLLNSKMT